MGRPHGTGGAFTVAEPGRRLDLLAPGQVVEVAAAVRRIVWRGGTEQRPLVRLDGVEDRSGAERLTGEPILVAREAIGELEAGEHLVDDLIGCAVTDGEARVGMVSGVLNLPSVDCLEVTRESAADAGAELLLVPLVADAVRVFDVAGRRIDVDMEFVEGSATGGAPVTGERSDRGH